MKKALKNYIHFTRTEQRGIIALSTLIFILLLIRFTMQYWVTPPPEDEPELLAQWKAFKQLHTAPDDENIIPGYETGLFNFDPNTLDSTGFIRLGLKPKTVRMLLNWRSKGKLFYHPDDIKPLYTLTEKEYKRIAPYIHIAAIPRPTNYYPGLYNRNPIPASIDLNKADSGLLVRLNGIGPTLAHKIVERRKALGGFLRIGQLNEIYRFPDTIFNLLSRKLVINTTDVQKLRLNEASLEEMKNHPYIGEKTARNIILYREGLNQFQNIEQLRQVPLMNEENYRKIAPYFTLD